MTFFRRVLIPVLVLLALALTLGGWLAYWRLQDAFLSQALPKTSEASQALNLGSANAFDLQKLANLSTQANLGQFVPAKVDGSEAPAVLGAPPWVKLSEKDLTSLMALASTGELGRELAALLPVYNTQQQQREHEDKWMKKGAIPKHFPFVFSGVMQVGGAWQALIEDSTAGTSYFRKSGDVLGLYTVMQVDEKSLVLVNPESGARVKLLRGKLDYELTK